MIRFAAQTFDHSFHQSDSHSHIMYFFVLASYRLKKIAVIFVVITPYHTDGHNISSTGNKYNFLDKLPHWFSETSHYNHLKYNIEKVLNQIWKLQVIKVNSTSRLKNIFIVNCCSSVFVFFCVSKYLSTSIIPNIKYYYEMYNFRQCIN